MQKCILSCSSHFGPPLRGHSTNLCAPRDLIGFAGDFCWTTSRGRGGDQDQRVDRLLDFFPPDVVVFQEVHGKEACEQLARLARENAPPTHQRPPLPALSPARRGGEGLDTIYINAAQRAPALSPARRGGEGGRRPGEGLRFMVTIHAQRR